jgi:16S rRNA (uracil1498-N3)-methyltransferase
VVHRFSPKRTLDTGDEPGSYALPVDGAICGSTSGRPYNAGVASGERASSIPAFFLRDQGKPGEPRLRPEDEQHAARVLRLRAGDPLIGLDGRGGLHPLRVRARRRDSLELGGDGPVQLVPGPGEEGSLLPWFEVAVAWPRRNRVDGMVDRLVQLGAAAIRPLVARQRGPEDVPAESTPRVQRVAREACKQSGRAWLPVLERAMTPGELARHHARHALAILDPLAGLPFDTWLRSLRPAPLGLGSRANPIVLVVGPEGGIAEEERGAFLEIGASPTWLGPHVLRVETAAEAAMAIAAVAHGRAPARPAPLEPGA